MAYEVQIEDLHAMELFANKVAKHIFSGSIICLGGELGAGKTTFTQFLGKAIGIIDTISSPTFTLMKVYEEGDFPLYHIDAYRLEGQGGSEELEEYIYEKGLCVIEWYRHIEQSIPKECLKIDMTRIDENQRLLRVEGCGIYGEIAKKISH